MTMLDPFSEITRTHRIVRTCPNGDTALGYGLAVPRGWFMASSIENVEQGPALPMLLGIFTEEEDTGSPMLTVTCTQLPEVELEDWVRCSHVATGWKLLGLQTTKDTRTRTICTSLREGAEAIVRQRTMFIDSGRLWCLTAAGRADRFQAVAAILRTSLLSFEVMVPTFDERLEPRATWSTNRYAFEVPSSWWTASSRRPEGDVNGHAYLVEHGQVLGMLRVRFRRRSEQDQAALERKLYDELHRSPLSPCGPITRITGPSGIDEETIDWAAGLACEADLAGLPVAVHMAVRRFEDNEVELRMITPRERDHPLAWMRGRRALHIAVRTAGSA